MRLVQDEPRESDRVQELGGIRFLIDRDLERRLEPYFPLQVDYFSRWSGIKVWGSRPGFC
jgi:hypothetical protein